MAKGAPGVAALSLEEEFELFYRRYVKDVYRYALALLHNPADAEDVTQTTFLNAYRAFQRGVRPIKPHNWLIKIVHNGARTRYARMNGRRREVPLDDYVERLELPDAEKPDLRAVFDALQELPFNQRAALVMRELEGRTYAEIADTLGVSVAAVETLIFRARRSLRVRAAELRVLGAVPLPGSLSQLFGGGGVAAGGGAVAGSGVLLKVSVAIVAGVVATGVGGDRTHDAGPSTAAQRSALARQLQKSAPRPAYRTRVHAITQTAITVRRRRGAAGDVARAARKTVPAEDAAASSGGEARASKTGSPSSPLSSVESVQKTVTQPASTAVETVQKALPVSLPSAPVTVPQLPSPPVEVPSPPSVPLPTLP
jgi:RNA polymerase sigma factor (sigma-70 family)